MKIPRLRNKHNCQKTSKLKLKMKRSFITESKENFAKETESELRGRKADGAYSRWKE